MGFLLEKCKLVKLDDKILSSCHPFTCGDADLDDFFQNDAMRYKKELYERLIVLFWMRILRQSFVCLHYQMIVFEWMSFPIIGDVSCRKTFQERNVCVDTLVY